MKKTFTCDCDGHIIIVDYCKKTKKFPHDDISFEIRELYGKTTKKLKRQKWLADVIIMNNKNPKELDKFFDFMEKIIEYRK